jgi:hypothetical protein
MRGSRWVRLSTGEFREALGWVTGVPLRPTAYCCPDCNRQGDHFGVHAAACAGSGAPTRGHHYFRDVLWRILGDLGYTVSREQALQNVPQLIPADVFVVTGLRGRPLALDVSIVAPAPSAAAPSHQAMQSIDVREKLKLKRYAEAYTLPL